ncbi:hypothetical protein D3C73_1412640 [compost metagenome]
MEVQTGNSRDDDDKVIHGNPWPVGQLCEFAATVWVRGGALTEPESNQFYPGDAVTGVK